MADKEINHNEESECCWCGPEILQPCPECDKEDDCFMCGGRGLIPAYTPDMGKVVVHKYE